MNIKGFTRTGFSWAMLLVAVLLIGAANSFGQKGGGGGGGGGGVTPVPSPTPAILPSTPPAPDIIMRESFGMADLARPTGGKGTVKPYQVHTALSGFWIEYPGSKDTTWLAPPETGQTWRVCGASDDPYEMFSPLQVTWGNGCIISDWFDPTTVFPTALMPFRAPATAYQISIDAWPGGRAEDYVGFGLTTSSLLESNLETSGSVWFMVKTNNYGFDENYELRANGMTGPLLASGTTYFDGHTRLVLRYDPVTKVVSASVNDVELGMFPQDIPTPKFIGIEGVGVMDNLVVRQLP